MGKFKMTKLFFIGCLVAAVSAVTDNDDGTSGNAPCINPYLAVCGECNSAIGEDPHLAHGCEADDGGIVAVGSSMENRSWYQSGSKYDALIIKTKGGCTYDENNYYLNSAGEGCDTWDWVTKLADNNGENEMAMSVAQSNDGTFFIVVGMMEVDGYGQIFISKLNADDGVIVWTAMGSGTGGGSASAETVAFTSDGGFVVGGGVDAQIPASEMRFKSGGQVTESSTWIAKVSASEAAGDSIPAFEWILASTETETGNVKSIRVDASDNIFFITGTETGTTLYKLDSAGSEEWNTGTETYAGI